MLLRRSRCGHESQGEGDSEKGVGVNRNQNPEIRKTLDKVLATGSLNQTNRLKYVQHFCKLLTFVVRPDSVFAFMLLLINNNKLCSLLRFVVVWRQSHFTVVMWLLSVSMVCCILTRFWDAVGFPQLVVMCFP